MPVSVSCTVLESLSIARAASESIAMTARGDTAPTTARTISPLSMPVTPITPGESAHTLAIAPVSSGRARCRCRVTSV